MVNESPVNLIPEPAAKEVAEQLFTQFDEIEFSRVSALALRGNSSGDGIRRNFRQSVWSDGSVYEGTGEFSYLYEENEGATKCEISVAFEHGTPAHGDNIIPCTYTLQHTGNLDRAEMDRIILDVQVPQEGYFQMHHLMFARDNNTGRVKFSTDLPEHLRGDALRFLNDGVTVKNIHSHIRTDLSA